MPEQNSPRVYGTTDTTTDLPEILEYIRRTIGNDNYILVEDTLVAVVLWLEEHMLEILLVIGVLFVLWILWRMIRLWRRHVQDWADIYALYSHKQVTFLPIIHAALSESTEPSMSVKRAEILALHQSSIAGLSVPEGMDSFAEAVPSLLAFVPANRHGDRLALEWQYIHQKLEDITPVYDKKAHLWNAFLGMFHHFDRPNKPSS